MSKTTYTNFNLFDGKSNEVKKSAWLVVDETTGKIDQVGTGDAPSTDQQVDLNGKYVMPGMVNCHTHICMDPTAGDGGTGANVVDATVHAVQHLHDLLKSGVTYIRECGSTFDIDIALNELRKKGVLKKYPRSCLREDHTQ